MAGPFEEFLSKAESKGQPKQAGSFAEFLASEEQQPALPVGAEKTGLPGVPLRLPTVEAQGLGGTVASGAAETFDSFMRGGAQAVNSGIRGVGGGIQAVDRAVQSLNPLNPTRSQSAVGAVGKGLVDFADQQQRTDAASKPAYAKVLEQKQADLLDHPELLKEPAFWANMGGNVVGSMMSMVPAGVGAASRAEKVAAVAGRFAPAVRAAAGPGAAAFVETFMDAGNTYQDAIDAGHSPEKAGEAAAQVFAREFPTTVAFDAAGLFNDQIKGRVRKALVSSLAESGQEPAQGLAQRTAERDVLGGEKDIFGPVPLELLSGLLGGPVGSLMLGGGERQVSQAEAVPGETSPAAPEAISAIPETKGPSGGTNSRIEATKTPVTGEDFTQNQPFTEFLTRDQESQAAIDDADSKLAEIEPEAYEAGRRAKENEGNPFDGLDETDARIRAAAFEAGRKAAALEVQANGDGVQEEGSPAPQVDRGADPVPVLPEAAGRGVSGSERTGNADQLDGVPAVQPGNGNQTAAEAQVGPHGPSFPEFTGKPQQAVAKLREVKSGFVPDAIQHPEIGGIGLVFGQPGEGARFRKGYGVSHIDAKRPGYLDAALERIPKMPVSDVAKFPDGRVNAIRLEDEVSRAVVSANWDGEAGPQWLLTAYDKKPGKPALGTNFRVPEAPARVEPASSTAGFDPTSSARGSVGSSSGRRMDVPGTHAAERQTPQPGEPASSIPQAPTGVNTPSEPVAKREVERPKTREFAKAIEQHGRWEAILRKAIADGNTKLEAAAARMVDKYGAAIRAEVPDHLPVMADEIRDVMEIDKQDAARKVELDAIRAEQEKARVKQPAAATPAKPAARKRPGGTVAPGAVASPRAPQQTAQPATAPAAGGLTGRKISQARKESAPVSESPAVRYEDATQDQRRMTAAAATGGKSAAVRKKAAARLDSWVEQAVINAKAESPITAKRLRQVLADVPREALNESAMRLHRAGKIVLHTHSGPMMESQSDRDALIYDRETRKYYAAAGAPEEGLSAQRQSDGPKVGAREVDAEELRTYEFGVSQAALDAYDPDKAVRKVGREWTYDTVAGKSSQDFAKTRREAVESARFHKGIKQQQFDRPFDFGSIGQSRAVRSLALMKKYQSDEGISDSEAASRANAAIMAERDLLESRLRNHNRPQEDGPVKPVSAKRKKGERGAISPDILTGGRAETLIKIVETGKARTADAYSYLVKPLADRIADEGNGSGKNLVKLLKTSRDRGEVAAGQLLAQLDDVKLSTLSKDERLELTDALEGRKAPTTPKVKEAFERVRELTDAVASVAVDLKVQVKGGKGQKRRDFVPRANYLPHIIRPVAALKRGRVREDIIANVAHIKAAPDAKAAERMLDEYIEYIESGKKLDKILDYLVGTGQAPDRATALARMERFKSQVKREGSLEYSREVNLPFYDPDPARVLAPHLASQAIRLTQIALFGQDDQRINAEILKMREAGANTKMVREAVDKILGRAQEADDAASRVSRLLRAIQTAKLGLAVIPNAFQGSMNSLVAADLSSVMLGWKAVLSKEGRRFAIESGAAIEPVLSEAHREFGDSELMTKYLNATGFSATEQLNRILAANAGKIYLGKLFEGARNGDKRGGRLLREMIGDEAADAALRSGKLRDRDLLLGAKRFSDLTQFRSRPEDLPGFASTNMGKVFFQFKSFAYNQTKLMHRETMTAFKNGEVTRGLRTLFLLAALFPLQGELVRLLREMIRGGDPKDYNSEWEHYWDALAASSALGVLGDVLQTTGKKRWLEFLAGPTLSTAGDTGNLLGTIADDSASDEAKNKAIVRYLRRHLPMGQVWGRWIED